MLRGGAYKPRTSPHDFQGSGLEGLCILSIAREETGLPIVTEVMDPRLVGEVAQVADMLQVGSRNMHNYSLLAEVGRARKPILLKRGMSASLCEWLGAAEYIAKQGNLDIVLCERGIRGFPSGEYSRYVLDLNVIPAAKMLTFLPIVVDPSHATGVSAMVEPASRAALEMGSHGLLIEVADFSFGEPKCDGLQAIDAATLARIVEFAYAHGDQFGNKRTSPEEDSEACHSDPALREKNLGSAGISNCGDSSSSAEMNWRTHRDDTTIDPFSDLRSDGRRNHDSKNHLHFHALLAGQPGLGAVRRVQRAGRRQACATLR